MMLLLGQTIKLLHARVLLKTICIHVKVLLAIHDGMGRSLESTGRFNKWPVAPLRSMRLLLLMWVHHVVWRCATLSLLLFE